MTTQLVTRTDEVLAGMLTENTGRHMLDSGGAYGRHWERHQGMTAQNFVQGPSVHVDRYGVTLDVFHYLRDRLEFAPEMQQEWEQFTAQQPEEGWFTLMDEFPEAYGFESSGSFNTYNFENSLSQVVQGVTFKAGDDCFVLLQIHGGCDVRGGYTAPKAFKVTTSEMPEAFYWDSGDWFAICPHDETHSLHVQHGEVTDWAGSLVREQFEFTDEGVKCPECGAVMTVEGCQPC